MTARLAVKASSGNVFSDLELPNAGDEDTKMDLAIAINDALAEQNLRQADIAKRIGATQPQVSALTNYKLSGFSIERLLGFLKALNRDVEIVCRSSGQAQGRVRVRQMA